MKAKGRLLEFLKYLGVGQNAFEKKVGISNGYIAHSKGSIGAEIVAKISSAYPELNITWLLTGEGEMLLPPKNEFSQIPPEEIGGVASESFTEYLLELYQKGEIYPAAVVEKMIAEKDAALAAKDEKIAQLQKRVWELENNLT